MKALVFAALLLVACSHQPTTPDPSKYEHLVIVGTNDFHGYLRPVETDFYGSKVLAGGAEWFAGYVRILQKHYGENLFLLDGGDIFQGTLDSNHFFGEPVLKYYNLLPYRAAAVGNHEFDYGSGKRGVPGVEVIRQRMSEAAFPFLSSNIYFKDSGKNWQEKNLYPSTIIKVKNFRIGVIGLTTQSASVTTLPMNVAQFRFGDLGEAVSREAQKLRSEGVDLVFITAHEGGDKPGTPMYDMLEHLPEGTVDAVVAGHTHLEIRKMINGTPVIEGYTRGRYFGRIDLYVDKQTKKVDQSLTKIADTHFICGNWFANSETCDAAEMRGRVQAGRENVKNLLPLRSATYEGEEVQADLQVRKTLQPYFAKVDEVRKEVLGTAREEFQRYPTGETDMGALMAHILHGKFPKAKAIYLNGGGIRRQLAKGTITYADVFEVYPFDNFITVVKMTGKDFKDMIRIGTAGARSIPSLYGIQIEIAANGDDASFQRDVNGDGKKEEWERDRLLKATWSNGAPIRDEEEFSIVTIDYLVQGGENMKYVFGRIPAKNIDIKDLTPRDTLAEYLRTHKGEYLPRKVKPSITIAN